MRTTLLLASAMMMLTLAAPLAAASATDTATRPPCIYFTIGGPATVAGRQIDVLIVHVRTDPVTVYVPPVASGSVCLFEYVAADSFERAAPLLA